GEGVRALGEARRAADPRLREGRAPARGLGGEGDGADENAGLARLAGPPADRAAHRDAVRRQRVGGGLPADAARVLERAARLVAAAAGADADERHAVRPGDRAAGRLRDEAEEGADPDRHLLALDAPVAGAGDDDVDLLLARARLVVL